MTSLVVRNHGVWKLLYGLSTRGLSCSASNYTSTLDTTSRYTGTLDTSSRYTGTLDTSSKLTRTINTSSRYAGTLNTSSKFTRTLNTSSKYTTTLDTSSKYTGTLNTSSKYQTNGNICTKINPWWYNGVGNSDVVFIFGQQQLRFYRSGKAQRNVRQNDDKPEPPQTTPQLMDFPWVIWPSLWHTIRNWILSNLLIYRYLDQEFSLSTFRVGAVQALVHVSNELSLGNFDALEDLFKKPTLDEIRNNFARLNLKQRLDLAVAEEDIFLSFPYQIGIIFTNEGSKHERIFVEITMCYHVFRGFQDFLKSKAEGTVPGGIKGVYENHDRISIANYRFIREFTQGVDDEWKVSLANHFKPGEVVQER